MSLVTHEIVPRVLCSSLPQCPPQNVSGRASSTCPFKRRENARTDMHTMGNRSRHWFVSFVRSSFLLEKPPKRTRRHGLSTLRDADRCATQHADIRIYDRSIFVERFVTAAGKKTPRLAQVEIVTATSHHESSQFQFN